SCDCRTHTTVRRASRTTSGEHVIPEVESELFDRYSKDDLKIIKREMYIPSLTQLQQQYVEHLGQPWLEFYLPLLNAENKLFDRYVDEVLFPKYNLLNEYCGNLFFIVEGIDAIEKVRHIHGNTIPEQAIVEDPNSIRAKYGGRLELGLFNVVHASKNEKDFEKEVKIYF
ncbi:hypothetical protein KY321_03440, partial [Candidatus Woesearchaeota archaeon]|nr:hypothetical protein [Candidatus Woesearchaeota archaeon]